MFPARAVPFVIAIFFFVPIDSAHAQSNDPCPGQGHISTGTGQDQGIPKGSKVCGNDGGQKALFGGCEANPYDILIKEYNGGSHNIAPKTGADGKSIGGIDGALACRLTKFFEVARQKGCNPKLSSGYRSETEQANACQRVCGNPGGCSSGCAAPGASCHQKGLAVDLTASCIGWMRMAAPQFRLVFPYRGQHIQCAEHPSAGVRSCNRPCDGGAAINPDLSRLPPPSQVPDSYFVPPQQAAPPTSGLSNQFRQALGMPQQPTISTTPVTPAPNTPSVPLPPQSQVCFPEYVCSGDTVVYKNTQCSSQTIERCPAGCSNGTCRVSTSTTPTGTIPTTTLNIIEQLGGMTATSTIIGTSTTLSLIAALSDPSSLQPSSSTSGFATRTIASIQSSSSQQTFTSGDLSNSGIPVNTGQSQRIFAILESLKRALLWALSYLHPFSISRREENSYITE